MDSTRSPAARVSPPTWSCPGCSTGTCCARRTRTRRSFRSTPRRRSRCPVSRRSSARDDFPEFPVGHPMRDTAYNLMARDRVRYEGQTVAAVAATTRRQAREAAAAIKVEYEVLPHVLTVDDVDGRERSDPPRRHDDARRRPGADQGVERRDEVDLQGRRSRCRLRLGRRRGRRRFLHQARASGLHRAACRRRRLDPGGQGGRLVLVAGPLPRAAADRRHARVAALADQGAARRDRRRLRRQDDDLSRAARRAAVAQGQPAGQDGHGA